MEIVVCVKQVPDITDVKMDPVTNTMVREGIPSTVNPFDRHALEAALNLKRIHGGRITAITMGPMSAVDTLRKCYTYGADRLVLVSDRAFVGSDTYATAYILAQAIRTCCPYDLIICGKQAIDGDTAQVGPELAEQLQIPQLTYASKIECDNGEICVDRELEDRYEYTSASLPALVTVVKSINELSIPHFSRILDAKNAELIVLGAKDLGQIDFAKTGIAGSPTKVHKIATPTYSKHTRHIQSEKSSEAVKKLLQYMQDDGISIIGGV